jgi:hypothetical protein
MDEMIQIKKAKEGVNANQAAADNLYYYEQTGTSRLEGVKMACIETLKSLKDDDPQKLVSMVTFSSDVKYFGDCSKNDPIVNTSLRRTQSISYNSNSNGSGLLKSIKSVFSGSRSGSRASISSNTNTSDMDTDEISSNIESGPVRQLEIAPDILENKEKMIALGRNQDGNLKPIVKAYGGLEHKIKTLKTEGSTALGPALVFSVGFSSKKSGSQVCICTDGCANVRF